MKSKEKKYLITIGALTLVIACLIGMHYQGRLDNTSDLRMCFWVPLILVAPAFILVKD